MIISPLSLFFARARHRLLGLEIDTPVANVAAKVGQTLTGGVSSEEKASIAVLLDSIRASKMWPTFTKMLDESGVSLLSLLWVVVITGKVAGFLWYAYKCTRASI